MKTEHETINDWLRAVGRCVGYRKLGAACGVRWTTPQYWARVGRVPPKHLAEVEQVTGIRRDKLNPTPFRDADKHP